MMTTWSRFSGWFGVLCVCLLLCSALWAEEPTTAAKAPPYRLQPGDEITVAVQPQKGFDCGGIVLPDGALYLKNVGKLQGAGRSLDDLTKQVREILNKNLVDPEVTISLVRMAPVPEQKPERPGQVTIVGGVIRPGPLPLETGLRLRKALDLAGGTLREADLTKIVVFHADLTRVVVDLSSDDRISDPEQNRILRDGDSIEVKILPPAVEQTVRIAGQVVNPGLYPLKEGMTLEDLIIAGGKLSTLADVERIELRRSGRAGIEVVNLADRQKLGVKGQVRLAPGDEFFVPEQTNRVIVIGAVPRAGPSALRPGSHIVDFFLQGPPELAGALNTATVALSDVEIIRPGTRARKLNLQKALRDPAQPDNVALQAGDVIYLPPRKAKAKGPLDYLQQLGPLSFLFAFF